ncbi:MAG: hypothetical protein E6R03_04975 [Hyphomicrobiaceae bacterium]|nr:MAG: hypothetical protein E6R03_04975 [Hyphomicrobiaceae bacterium]
MALSAAGTFLETREANKNAKRVQNARNAAYQESMNRQARFADESGAAFNHNITRQGREAFDEEAAAEGDRLKQAFGNVQTQPDYNNMGMLASTPGNVVAANKEAVNKADMKTNRDLEGLSKLTGYGGAMFNQDLSRNDFARLFGNIQDKAAGQMRLMPLEIEAAGNNASKSPSLFPTLLRGVGAAMGVYGAGNGITSFGDKVVPGAMPAGVYGPGVATTQPGLFTNLKQLPSKITGGRLY